MHDSLCDESHAETSTRSLSALGCATSSRMESTQVKRPAISLVLPTSTALETILPIHQGERSTNDDWISQRDEQIVLTMTEDSCFCWTMRNVIYLLYVTLLACLMGLFIFTLVCYAFESYWLEQSLTNNSSWWWTNANDTDFPEDGSDLFNIPQTMNYDDQN